MEPRLGLPAIGVGVGLRSAHFRALLGGGEDVEAALARIDWFEATPENFLGSEGLPAHVLDRVAERFPVALHGVTLNLGSTDPLDLEHVRRLKALAARLGATWISDHVCWTGVAGLQTHDLLPLPYTEESLAHLVERVDVVQDVLERPLVLENPSTYLEFEESTLDEPMFLRALAERTGCGLLLDVNNVCVSAFNHGWDARAYVDALPLERVCEVHVAGHCDRGTHRIDTHDRAVASEVWELLALVAACTPGVPVLVEWDANVPDLERLAGEAERARRVVRGESPELEGDLPDGDGTGPTAWPQPLDAVVPEVS